MRKVAGKLCLSIVSGYGQFIGHRIWLRWITQDSLSRTFRGQILEFKEPSWAAAHARMSVSNKYRSQKKDAGHWTYLGNTVRQLAIIAMTIPGSWGSIVGNPSIGGWCHPVPHKIHPHVVIYAGTKVSHFDQTSQFDWLNLPIYNTG